MILIDQQLTHAGSLFADHDEVQFFDGVATSIKKSKANALLIRSVTQVDSDLLSKTSIRFVGSLTSGVDHVDVEGLSKQGIHFAHAPGCNADSVCEYVLAGLFEYAMCFQKKTQPPNYGSDRMWQHR